MKFLIFFIFFIFEKVVQKSTAVKATHTLFYFFFSFFHFLKKVDNFKIEVNFSKRLVRGNDIFHFFQN